MRFTKKSLTILEQTEISKFSHKNYMQQIIMKAQNSDLLQNPLKERKNESNRTVKTRSLWATSLI